MKFEDLLMEPGDKQKQTKLDELQDEVETLERELDGEVQVSRVLQCAMQGPVGCCESCSTLSYSLPFKVQMLLADVAIVEEEIDWLERKINELKMDIYQEKKHIKKHEALRLKELPPQWDQRQIKKLNSRRPNDETPLPISHSSKQSKYRTARERRASLGSSIDLTSVGRNVETEESGNSRSSNGRISHNQLNTETEIANPDKLSIELIKCLIGIFLKLNQSKSKGVTNLSKQTLKCMNPKGLVPKATFSCKTSVFPFNNNASHLDPYAIFPEPDFTIRDVGPYKDFIQITTSTVDANRLSECLPAMRRLSVLMQKLSKINISYSNHKQKLAFWINVYNASVMHAFLQHGLPSTEEKLLAMNEAVINVGGVILKACTIEHFILRHPAAVKHELTNDKEVFLSQACGLAYPEPNIIFALCRGSWSSPALRVYTADEVMNELEKAKVEYLEASVGITSRKKILLPKLMHRQMKDFADDMDSLLEWIYSQLPYTSSLKRLIMECLNGETHSPSQKMIEIQPYASEFRYLIPV